MEEIKIPEISIPPAIPEAEYEIGKTGIAKIKGDQYKAERGIFNPLVDAVGTPTEVGPTEKQKDDIKKIQDRYGLDPFVPVTKGLIDIVPEPKHKDYDGMVMELARAWAGCGPEGKPHIGHINEARATLINLNFNFTEFKLMVNRANINWEVKRNK